MILSTIPRLYLYAGAVALILGIIWWNRYDAAKGAVEALRNAQNQEVVKDVEKASKISDAVNDLSADDIDKRLRQHGWIRQGLLSIDPDNAGLRDGLSGDEKANP